MTRVPAPSNPLLAEWTARSFDRERKIVRALEELGPIGDRDVALAGTVPPWLVAELGDAGARIVGPILPDPLAPGGADVVIGAWSAFRGADDAEIAEARARLRPAGRLLAIHDYGRDEIDRLEGDRPESSTWSRRDGPFTAAGFKIRVVHCWWTFDSIEDTARFLRDAFGDAATALAATALGAALRRPRLSHNIAIYHRDAAPA